MKKIFIFIFVIVVAFSCIVLPFASADSVTGGDTSTTPYTFNGSFIHSFLLTSQLSPFPTFTNTVVTGEFNTFANFDFNFILSYVGENLTLSFVSNNNAGMLYPWDGEVSYADTELIEYFLTSYSRIGSTSIITRTNSDSTNAGILYPTESLRFLQLDSRNTEAPNLYLPFYVYYNGDFNCNVVSRSTFYDSESDCNILTYYDIDNNFVRFRFPLYLDYENSDYWWEFWQDRYNDVANFRNLLHVSDSTFYYENYFDNNEDYDIGYDNGYNDGYNDGESIGYDNGFDIGFDQGDIIGYNRGYSEGIENAGDYTFTGLISAVFDAPIKAFRGLLDFNLLGVDMAQFALSLFSLSLIVVVVRLLLAR